MSGVAAFYIRRQQLRLRLGGHGLPQCTAIVGLSSWFRSNGEVVDACFRTALGTTVEIACEKLVGTVSVRELPKLHTSVLMGRPVRD